MLFLIHAQEHIPGGLDMQIAEELGKDIARHRCGNLAAVENPERIIYHHEDRHLRILHRGKAAEGCNIAAIHVACAVLADLLGRSRLSRDAVALDSGFCAAARGDYLLQEPHEGLVRHRLNRPADPLLLRLHIGGAIRIPDGLHDMGL